MAKTNNFKYAFQLTLDKNRVAIVDNVIASGRGVNFSDAVRYCIDEQGKLQEAEKQRSKKPCQ